MTIFLFQLTLAMDASFDLNLSSFLPFPFPKKIPPRNFLSVKDGHFWKSVTTLSANNLAAALAAPSLSTVELLAQKIT